MKRFNISANEKLFNRLKYFNKYFVNELSSIVQNDMELSDSDIRNWKESAIECIVYVSSMEVGDFNSLINDVLRHLTSNEI